MKQNIKEELNYIKYLFGYEKGLVISEQRVFLTEGTDTAFFTQPEILLDGQTWEGQKKSFTGSWKVSTKNPQGFKLTSGDFTLPSGGSVPAQIDVKPNVETDIPFTLTLDPADTNQKSIFNFLNRDKKIFFNISVKVGEELENLTFTANFTQVSTQGTTGTGTTGTGTGTTGTGTTGTGTGTTGTGTTGTGTTGTGTGTTGTGTTGTGTGTTGTGTTGTGTTGTGTGTTGTGTTGTGGSPAAEKINTTNDRAYDYKLSNGKYYFKGKSNTQYAKKYPDWVEAKGTGLGHIMTNVKF
jgi:hypothetical protein